MATTREDAKALPSPPDLLRRFFRDLGPGLIIGAADDDGAGAMGVAAVAMLVTCKVYPATILDCTWGCGRWGSSSAPSIRKIRSAGSAASCRSSGAKPPRAKRM